MSRKPRAQLEVECPRCHAVYEVTSEEVIRGTWRDCPQCNVACDEPQTEEAEAA